MSLRTFHVFFITLASLLAFGFGAWGLRYHQNHGDAVYLGLGVSSLLSGLLLVVYGIWFVRKLKVKGL